MDRIFGKYVSIIKLKQTRIDKQNILLEDIKIRLYRSIKPKFIAPNHKIGIDPYIFTVDFGIFSNSCRIFVHVLHHSNIETLLKNCLFKASCLKKLDGSNNPWNAEIIKDIPDSANEKTSSAWEEGTGILKDTRSNVSNTSNAPKQIDKIIAMHTSQK